MRGQFDGQLASKTFLLGNSITLPDLVLCAALSRAVVSPRRGSELRYSPLLPSSHYVVFLTVEGEEEVLCEGSMQGRASGGGMDEGLRHG